MEEIERREAAARREEERLAELAKIRAQHRKEQEQRAQAGLRAAKVAKGADATGVKGAVLGILRMRVPL
jgi:hypothetical protein